MVRAKNQIELASEFDGAVLLSAGAVAKRLAVGKRTFWRLVSEGRFPPADLRVTTATPRWKRETLERWVEEQSSKRV